MLARGRISWHSNGHSLFYELDLKRKVRMTARAILEYDGARFLYEFENHSDADYEIIQPVTCVKLCSAFSDVFLERTFVHHREGFDLLASETPERLKMTREQWLPCRYLVPYIWPVVPADKRIEKRADSITWYNKSRRVDEPVIATLSQDRKWVAATYTPETGNVWTNPERTCQHSDPAAELGPGEIKRVELKTFVFEGSLDQLLAKVERERKSQALNGLPPYPSQA